MRLKGKTALIAGAGRNNGRVIALTFAREGADLVLVSRQLGDELDEVTKQCEAFGVKTLPLLADVADSAQVNRVVKQGLEKFGKVDVLVNVVGIRPNKLPWEVTDEEWRRVFAVNCDAAFYLSRALAPGMMERKSGSIIALGGHSALTATAGHQTAMAASKHALYGLIKGLAQALGPYGVRANLLCLAHIENERRNPEWFPWYEKTGRMDDVQKKIADTPMGRLGKPQETANAALFLASDESSFITGDCIVCAGGSQL